MTQATPNKKEMGSGGKQRDKLVNKMLRLSAEFTEIDAKIAAAKRGRPSKGPKKNLGMAITSEAMEALDRLAEAKGKPKAAVIEALILDAANGPAPLPKEAMDFAHEAADFLALHNHSDKAIRALETAAWSAMGMARLSMGGKG